jgi:hypothetical protein
MISSHRRSLSIMALSLTSFAFVAQAQAPGLFFRQADRPEVMFQFRPDAHCHVQNQDQMAAYGGFARVQVVPALRMGGASTGECAWPDGFYRRSNGPEVYRLHGGDRNSDSTAFRIGHDICHVVNEEQMEAFGGFGQVRVVAPTSELENGRGRPRDCANP